jgi:hypothetical protein
MRLATLTHEVHQPIRYVNQTGGDYFAVFTLRITPACDSEDVRFSCEASDPDLTPGTMSAIERGVREFVAQRQRDGKPVGCFRVAVTEIQIHPVDTREFALAAAAFKALTQAFGAHETLVDV